MKGAVGILIRKELSELRRDRRVLFFTLVLPVLLYPVVIGGMDRLETSRQTETRSATLEIAVSPGSATLYEALAADSSLALRAADPDSLPALVERGEVSLGVELPSALPPLGSAAPETVRLHLRRTLENSREAERRVHGVFEGPLESERQRRWEVAGGRGDLEAVLGLSEKNLASASAEAGAKASRMLVYLLLMTLFMAGSAFATDMVAGEKERQTLETLFLAPVDRGTIARSKLLVVAGGTAITGLLSLLSLSVSYALGWLGSDGGGSLVLDAGTLVVIGLLVLPLAVLLGSVLLAISAWARSLKEAQYYVLPVMLVVFVPALMSMTQAIELNLLVAILPVANVAFVMRDVLTGQMAWGMLGLVLVSTMFWIAVVSRQVTELLSREETVLGFDPEPLLARSQGGRRRAAHIGMASSVLAYFYLGQLLQAWNLQWGLALSLWVLLPLLGLATALLVRPEATRGWRDRLSLRGSSVWSVLGGAMIGWGLMLPIGGGLARLQSWVLPMAESQAESFAGAFESFGPLVLFVLAALSPAIFEELVFRGVFLGILVELGSRRRAVILSATWFSLIHLSIYRFAPTFVLGVVLALLTVRHRSLLPASALHLCYNGTLLLGGLWAEEHVLPFEPNGALAWGLSLAVLGLGILLSFGPPRLRWAGSTLS